MWSIYPYSHKSNHTSATVSVMSHWRMMLQITGSKIQESTNVRTVFVYGGVTCLQIAVSLSQYEHNACEMLLDGTHLGPIQV